MSPNLEILNIEPAFIKLKNSLEVLRKNNGGQFSLEEGWILKRDFENNEQYQFVEKTKIWNVFNIPILCPVEMTGVVLDFNPNILGQNLIFETVGAVDVKGSTPGAGVYVDEDVLNSVISFKVAPQQNKPCFLQIYNAWEDEEGYVDSVRNSAYYLQKVSSEAFLLRVNIGTQESIFNPIDFDDMLILVTLREIEI